VAFPAPVPAEHHRRKRSKRSVGWCPALWCCRARRAGFLRLAIRPKRFRGVLRSPSRLAAGSAGHRCRQPISHGIRRWAGVGPGLGCKRKQPIPGARAQRMRSRSASLLKNGDEATALGPGCSTSVRRPPAFATFTRASRNELWAREFSSEVRPPSWRSGRLLRCGGFLAGAAQLTRPAACALMCWAVIVN